MKNINDFLYEISEDGSEVTIARKAKSNLAGQMAVNQQMEGVLTRTGMYRDVVYEGYFYIGIIFHNTISEEELVAALSVPPHFSEKELLGSLPVLI